MSDEHKLDIEVGEQDIGIPRDMPTVSPEPGGQPDATPDTLARALAWAAENPTQPATPVGPTGVHLGLHCEPRYCEACGGRLPDMAGLNIPEGEGDVTLTADQAARFRAAYLSLFAFWMAHQTAGNLAIADASLKRVGL